MADDAALPEPDQVAGYPHPRETRALFGQQDAQDHFLDAWRRDRLHHAWLLRGSPGVGKATLAYRIARALIAHPVEHTPSLLGGHQRDVPGSLDAPPGCPTLARIQGQGEPCLFVLRRTPTPDAKRMRSQIAVDDVRRMRRFLNLSSADGSRRVIIVDAADDMNRSSANALLKYLEEPPEHCVFLLVCHAPAGLLPTIRSRCRTLDLAPLGVDALSSALHGAGAEIPEDEAQALAVLGGGSAGQALRLAASDGAKVYDRIVGLLGAGRMVDRAGMSHLAELCAGRNESARYHMVIALVQTLLARLARRAALGASMSDLLPGEAALAQNVAAHPSQAHVWAETAQRLSTTTRHAVAVNLDPAQTIVDTFLELDAALGRVRMAAH